MPLWRQIQRENFTDIHQLITFLQLDETEQKRVLLNSKFPLNLPRRLAEKIPKNTVDDPICKQFLPLKDELTQLKGFCTNPVGDEQVLLTSKLLHKYQKRALLVCTSQCVMNCRFCFRQHFPYEKTASIFEKELSVIRQDSSLEEVILSGGDPLSLGDHKLGALLHQLEGISHLKKIRFHTRFPIGIPERIDDAFLSLLAKCSLQIIFVIHVNHVNELDADVLTHLKRIQKLGIPVLSQTVLLKGVNDVAASLHNLFSTLTNHGIMPYYLHQLDKVQGACHFEVPSQEGLNLIAQLKKTLPGYAVPRYVQEIAGRSSKTDITPLLLTSSLEA